MTAAQTRAAAPLTLTWSAMWLHRPTSSRSSLCSTRPQRFVAPRILSREGGGRGVANSEVQHRGGGAHTLLSFSWRSFPAHLFVLCSGAIFDFDVGCFARILCMQAACFERVGLGCPVFSATAVRFLSFFFPAPLCRTHIEPLSG